MSEATTRVLPVARSERERWIAGVCGGLAEFSGRPVGLIRALFLVGALLGGLGAAAYIAIWLILPSGRASSGGVEAAAASGAVTLARATAAAAGLLALAGLSALATVFGLGWVVLVVAAILAFGLVLVRRASAAGTLLPLAALTLPAVAVAASPVRLAPRFSAEVTAPISIRSVEQTTFRGGLGTELIDLRRVRWPASGTVTMHVAAGIRRTIVALPNRTCVHVQVAYRVRPFASELASLLDSHVDGAFEPLVLFGRITPPAAGRTVLVDSTGANSGPTLKIDFASQGGGLYVRNYPVSVDPDTEPNWPGFAVPIDPRPVPGYGLTHKQYTHELHYWRHRVAQERMWRAALDAQLPGPCAS